MTEREARAREEADPCGMTTKKGNGNRNRKGKGNGNRKGKGKGNG